MIIRTCDRCGIEKELKIFNFNKDYLCRTCTIEANKFLKKLGRNITSR
jgi:hypothetical protein